MTQFWDHLAHAAVHPAAQHSPGQRSNRCCDFTAAQVVAVTDQGSQRGASTTMSLWFFLVFLLFPHLVSPGKPRTLTVPKHPRKLPVVQGCHDLAASSRRTQISIWSSGPKVVHTESLAWPHGSVPQGNWLKPGLRINYKHIKIENQG